MARAWQLEMYRRSLKKRQKVALLRRMLGRLADERCLLITGGDNNGAINHQLRETGGSWTWAELEADAIPGMEELLGEPVHHVAPETLPFPASEFDRVVTVDVHEHLTRTEPFNREIARVLGPGGQALVTTPNGDPHLPVARLKQWLGMTPDTYGHVVQGFRPEELARMLERVDLQPVDSGAYARFFTELVELAINFVYVKVLSGGDGNADVEEGTIAPKTRAQLDAVGPAYRAYAAVYPVLRAVSALDRLLPGQGGYAVAVAARKPV